MKTLIFPLLSILLLEALNLNAQNVQLINGKIIDAYTNKPIESVSIYSRTTGMGTVSNSDGVFQFKLDAVTNIDSLVISCIGYKSNRLSFSDIVKSSDELLIKLVPMVVTLNEVTISPSPDPKEIIEKSKEKIDQNYNQNPFLSDCYFSEFIKEDGNYIRAMELAIQQYNKGVFPNPLIAIPMQQIKVVEKRKSANNTTLTNSIFNRCFSLNYLLLTSNLRNFLNTKNYKYTLDSITKIDNVQVYIITGKNNTEVLNFTVTRDTYKILKVEFKWNYSLPKYKIDNYFFCIQRTEGTIVFKEKENKLFPFYTTNKLFINYYENKNDTACWHKQDINSELLYTNIKTDNVKEIDKNERLEILTYPNIYELDIPNNEALEDHMFIQESSDRKLIYDSINAQKK